MSDTRLLDPESVNPALVSFVFALFCVPECMGKSLEEIGMLFNKRVRVRKFQKVTLKGYADAEDNSNNGVEVEFVENSV